MKELLYGIPCAPEGLDVTDILVESAQFPGLAKSSDTLYIHYQAFKDRHDTLKVMTYEKEKLSEATVISGEGDVLYPVSLPHDGKVWYAWSEAIDGQWEICARYVQEGQWSELYHAAKDEALLYPFLYTFRGELFLMWTDHHRNSAKIMNSRWNGEAFETAECLSVSSESFCGNACEGGDGNLYLTYDVYADSSYHTYVRVKTEAGWSEEKKVDRLEHWTVSPKVIRSNEGATVVWYTFGYGAQFGVYSADVTAKDGVEISEPETLLDNVGWYMNLTASANENGLQILCYTWSKDALHIRYRKNGGKWSLPAHISYEDIHCAMLPGVLVGEDETVAVAWQWAYRNGHFDRNARVVLTHCTPEWIDARGDDSVERSLNAFQQPIPGDKVFEKHSPEVVQAWLDKNGYEGKLLFGDIHGQSGISDGMGRIDQYYRRSLDKPDLQFSCLTDHDCYPDWISQSEWELMRTTARIMDEDDRLTCLLSYEWTPNEYQYDFGHKNVYYRDDRGDLFRSGERAGATPTDLYNSIRQYDAMCIPHHPAADWGHVSAATDWIFHDDEVQRLAEIFSRHAPYEDTASVSKYTKNIKKFPNHCVQDALARGYRMGFTAGSDSHQMEHGLEGGIVAVYTSAHSRAGIWDAMYDRKTYGTTGARILLSLKCGEAIMGSELKVAAGQSVTFDISVLGTQNVRVDLVKNNENVATWEPGDKACDVTWTDENRSASDYYYVRVTQPDDHMAWSSPIWVDVE